MDRDLDACRFTDQARGIIGFRGSDLGGPLGELTTWLEDPQLLGGVLVMARTPAAKLREPR